MNQTSFLPYLGDIEPAMYQRRGAFHLGATLTQQNDVVLFDADFGGDGLFYQYVGNSPLPYDVVKNSAPNSDWVSVGKATAFERKVNTFTFKEGGVLTNPNDVIFDHATGERYNWNGALPKPVPANSTIAGTGGIHISKWQRVGMGQTYETTIDDLKKFAVNIAGNKNPIPQKHDYNFVSSQFKNTPFRLVLNPADMLQSVDGTFKVEKDKEVTIKLMISGIPANYDFNAAQTENKGVFCVIGNCTDLNRTGFAQKSGVMSYDGSILEVRLSADRNTTGFVSVGVRIEVEHPSFVNISDIRILQNDNLVGVIPLDRLPPKKLWGGASRFQSVVEGLGFDFGINLLLGANSILETDDFLKCDSGGSMVDIKNNSWGLELNRAWAAKFPQFNKWYFGSGEHHTYRRVTSLSITKPTFIFGEDGAMIMGGPEIKTNTWEKVGEFTGGHVYKAPYDYESNPDSAIRNGTKTPFVSIRVPSQKSNSMRSYRLTSVSSIDAVNTRSYSFFYDHANKMIYFNWGTGNDSAYLYICEVDNIILATSSVYAAGCSFLAGKTDLIKVQPAVYDRNMFCGFYQCMAGVSVGGNGAFAINDIDSELINCIADSHLNDGFNFHNSGVSLLSNCITRCNGDDGISHHESCIGYVVNCNMEFNYAAASVPAFGARVWHYNCNATPAISLSGKNYSGKYACISGQDKSTRAWYTNCFISDRGSISEYYHCSSQQDGTTCELNIISPSFDNKNIPLYKNTGNGSNTLLSMTEMF